MKSVDALLVDEDPILGWIGALRQGKICFLMQLNWIFFEKLIF